MGLCDQGELDAVPDVLGDYTLWQYDSGSHASAARIALGSVILTAKSDSGLDVNIRHLVFDGSSQWVIGENVTKHASILHVEQNVIDFLLTVLMTASPSLEMSFLAIPLAVFAPNVVKETALTCLNGTVGANYSWKQIKAVSDKVQGHVCGHANFTDMRLLLQRNNKCSDMAADYVGRLVESCVTCRSAAPPHPSQKKVNLIFVS